MPQTEPINPEDNNTRVRLQMEILPAYMDLRILEVLRHPAFTQPAPPAVVGRYAVVAKSNFGNVPKRSEATVVTLVPTDSLSICRIMGVYRHDVLIQKARRAIFLPTRQMAMMGNLVQMIFISPGATNTTRLVNIGDKAQLMHCLQEWLFWSRLPDGQPVVTQLPAGVATTQPTEA